jgi:hypothetical protein
MKLIFAVLILISCQFSFTQSLISSDSPIKYIDHNSKTKSGDVLLGIDVILHPVVAPIGYVDINLAEKILFLKLEMGGMFYENGWESMSGEYSFVSYASAGLNVSLINKGNSRIYAGLGLTSLHFQTLGAMGNIKYLYKFSDNFGLSASMRIPVPSNEFMPLWGLGVQFLNN